MPLACLIWCSLEVDRMTKTLLSWALCVLSAVNAWSQVRVLPVDEAAKVPDFFVFRAQLQNAVARHDAKTVLSHLHPDLMMGFGSEQGLADFVARWKPHDAQTPLWDTMSNILALGGAFTADGAFIAPYTSARWPAKAGIASVAALGANVSVHSAPDKRAPAVGQLNFEVLARAPSDNPTQAPAGWTAIQWPGRKIAYVESRLVRSPADYSITFQKTAGRWQIIAFSAGD